MIEQHAGKILVTLLVAALLGGWNINSRLVAIESAVKSSDRFMASVIETQQQQLSDHEDRIRALEQTP